MNENLTMPTPPVESAGGGVYVTPADPARASTRWASSVLARLLRDSAYVLTALPWAVVTFTALVTGLSLAVSLLIVVIGIPVAVTTLWVAGDFAHRERRRLEVRGTPLTHARPPVPMATEPGLRGMIAQLADRDRWAETVHGITVLPLAVATWTVAVTWWTGTIVGLTYWAWAPLLPASANTGSTVDLLNLPISESTFNLVVGLVFAVTLVPVVHGCANLHAAWARTLLSGNSRRALAERVDELTVRRVAAASAEAQSLRRFERDLHDGPQQRLVRLGMDLSVAERRLDDDDPATARELLGQARTQVSEALAELRALSRGIAPPILADRGLEAALAAIAARSAAPTTLDVDLGEGVRPTAAIENAAYFVVCEALTNTAKHAAASSIAIRLRATTGPGGGRVLHVEVEDDGVGGADLAKGHGLAGLADRVIGLDGSLSVDSPAGGPTRLVAELPC
ncbi:sensor histidine kinase [Pengzhenrongella phosphoraccumulans]|uniref:sensor histidine kinase n=1 Tax=Pengzhenrongella phosphoraccumulans TaxID=3114394 RepID=UPI00388F38C9